ncbi:MAG: prenyltransferase [Bacteroidales bacterium]|nr:prenyltransferase [Bacteroidales bacterium]
MEKLTLKDWFFAVSPWSYPVSASPAIIALLYTMWVHPESIDNWPLGVLAVAGAIIFHSGGNLISDYHDFRTGVDQAGNGAKDSLTSGRFTPKQILYFGWSFILLGALLGVVLAYQSGANLLWVGIFGGTGAVFYYMLKAKALGDLLIFLIFGPIIMTGVGFVMLGYYDWRLILVSLPVAFITVDVLHSNNTRDIQRDSEAGLITFAKILGIKSSIFYYCLLIFCVYASVIVMGALKILPLWTLITLITIPVALRNCRMIMQIKENDVTPINTLDISTAQLQLLFSISMLLALILTLVI